MPRAIPGEGLWEKQRCVLKDLAMIITTATIAHPDDPLGKVFVSYNRMPPQAQHSPLLSLR